MRPGAVHQDHSFDRDAIVTSNLYAVCIRSFFATALFTLCCLAGPPAVAQQDGASVEQRSAAKSKSQSAAKAVWIDLKDGWKAIEFGGEGDVKITDGAIRMGYGSPITGVRWTGPLEDEAAETSKSQPSADGKLPVLPRDNYELRWECRRDSGFDFLCAFTFPVGKQRASLVMGGWGGGITGLSSIDGADASDNQTTMFKAFDNDKWYSARVRVDSKKITVWVDDTELFDHPREGHEFDIRFEMDPCLPFGIANFECDSQIRNIQIRRLAAAEVPGGGQGDR